MSAAEDQAMPMPRQVLDALMRAQAMSEAIRAIAQIVADGELKPDVYSLMQAIDACTVSLDQLVDPLIDAAVAR